jgi:hypothetical protein
MSLYSRKLTFGGLGEKDADREGRARKRFWRGIGSEKE